ncbi:MAG TPA: hypothetical protein VMI93_06590 [Candidatus Solibacter sp.]|nr:hypothetical protein [Candidatus Solibacter sp.]
MDDLKTEDTLEGVEIAVAMQQRVTLADAECGDKAVDCPADGVAAPAEDAEVARGGDGCFFATAIEYIELTKFGEYDGRALFLSNALEYFAEDHVGESEGTAAELAIEKIRLGIPETSKMIHPDGGIHNDHRRLPGDAAETGLIEVAFPADFAAEAANGCLGPGGDDQAQSCFNGRALGPGAGFAHGFAHEAIVDIDVGAHG